MSSSKSQVKDKGITKSTSRPLPQSVFDEVDATIVKTFETRGAKGDPILIAAARNIKSRFIKPEHFDLVQKLLTEDKDFARRYFFHVDFFPQIIDRYQQMSRTKQIREPITDNNVMGRLITQYFSINASKFMSMCLRCIYVCVCTSQIHSSPRRT